MFINLIIDQLLPLQPRLASRIPRTSRFAPFSKFGSRSYIGSPAKDALRSKTDSISQGHVTSPQNKNPQNVQAQYVRDAQAARANANRENESMDSASLNAKPDPRDKTKGNPEGLGMVDQVGSAMGSAKAFEDRGRQ